MFIHKTLQSRQECNTESLSIYCPLPSAFTTFLQSAWVKKKKKKNLNSALIYSARIVWATTLALPLCFGMGDTQPTVTQAIFKFANRNQLSGENNERMHVFTVEIFNKAMFTQQNYSLCYALCSLQLLPFLLIY